MSTFKWELSEPAQTDARSGIQSGTVGLEKLTPVYTGKAWKIELPDGSVAIITQPGGEVELTDQKAVKQRGFINNTVINFGIVVFILLIALMVTNDVFRGNLTFTQFVQVVVSFLAGLGVSSFRRNQSKTRVAKRQSNRCDV